MSNKLSFSNLKNAVSGSISEYSLMATKGIALTMAGLVLTVGLSTNSLVASAAKDNTPKSYEAMLSVELQPNTTTKDLAKAIKADVGNLNDVDIMSLSSKLDFEGKTQTFTKSNEDQLNTQKLLDSYSKSQNAFLTTLVNFKDQTDKGQTIENQEAIKPLLNKYNKDILKATETKYKTKTPVVSSVVIGGSLANLNKLTIGKVKAISVKAELINIKEIERQSNNLQAKLDKAPTQEVKDKILKDEMSKIMPNGADQSALNLDQDQIKEIDKLTRRDLNGNIFITASEVKSKLNLSDKQIEETTKAMNRFNQMPLEIKDNSVGSIQAITQTTSLKTEENNQKDLGEKVSQLFLGSVKASAGDCGDVAFTGYWQWWGGVVINSRCGWWSAGIYLAGIAFLIAMIASMLGVNGGKVISTIIGVSGSAGWAAGNCQSGKSRLVMGYWNFWQGGSIECN